MRQASRLRPAEHGEQVDLATFRQLFQRALFFEHVDHAVARAGAATQVFHGEEGPERRRVIRGGRGLRSGAGKRFGRRGLRRRAVLRGGRNRQSV